MADKTRRNGKGAIVRDKKQPTVTGRGKDPILEAVERRKAATDQQVNAHAWQQANKAAMPIHTALQRLTQGNNAGITTEQVMQALRVNKHTNPTAYTMARKIVNELADKGHDGRDLVSGYALELHQAMEYDKAAMREDFGPDADRYDTYRQVTGHKHPRDPR